MAVKPEVIKARLKALFPKANLSQKRLDALAAKLCQKPADDADDAAVDVVLNDANDIFSFEEIAREDDRVRTLEAKANPPADPPAPPTPPAPPSGDDDEPAWAKKLFEKVDRLEKKNETESKQTLANKAIQASTTLSDKYKAKWINRIALDSEVSFEDQVKELEEEYSDLMQFASDNETLAGPTPKGGNDKGPSDAELDAITNSIR